MPAFGAEWLDDSPRTILANVDSRHLTSDGPLRCAIEAFADPLAPDAADALAIGLTPDGRAAGTALTLQWRKSLRTSLPTRSIALA